MAAVNKAIIIGYLGGDPEVRFTPGGQAVANFNVATTEKWEGKDGNREERTEWHRIVVWGKLAELCGEYLRKGRKAYIEGSLQTRSYEKDGVTRYVTEIKAREVQFLDKAEGNGAPAQQSAPAPKPAQKPDRDSMVATKKTSAPAFGAPNYGETNEDIPF